ncbi:MAG: nuclear transport factor 2 family protein [Burkholderiaceae bacterium]|nr:nuclear transport factor 2 family protein [Burkholderiaceae bacterium]
MAHPRPLQALLLATPDETEAQFYEAMQTADVERMMALWADDDEVACVHPQGPRLLGAHAIRAGFDEMFGRGGVDLRAVQVRRSVIGHCAVHQVLEQVRVATPEGPQTGHLIATNVYVKTPQGWRMLLHHASPGGARESHELGDAPSTLH